MSFFSLVRVRVDPGGRKDRQFWCTMVRSLTKNADEPLDMVFTIRKMLSFGHVRNSCPHMCRLAEIALVIPVVTAECERGFSSMGRIKTKAGNRLGKLLAKPMRISIQVKTKGYDEMRDDCIKRALQVWMEAGEWKCSFPGAL
jgi:hypothetical protein